ncbi:MBL fold metallo-hydrolase [Amycolatopsis minnesotensis]|uniref:MBL fold metallo-hydrolase n=1 Tax=Amycolatopsis minnesotensis TaxID=337894 RepID=A0ABN2QS30_9PSEU
MTNTIRYLGGPTAVLELGGIRLLTDPTFDQPGEYPIGDRSLVKTAGPAVAPAGLGQFDVTLLSHDQHPDNLDQLGRESLAAVPLVLTTEEAAERLGGAARALPNWTGVELPRPGGGTLRITGLPALHGPPGSEPMVGTVTGFLLSGDGLPTVYVSGDNASLGVVRSIAERGGRVDVAVLFAGAAKTPLTGDDPLTLTSESAVEAARVLGARQVVPLHFEHWAHFTQGPGTLREAFEAAGMADRLWLPRPGETVALVDAA